jgi:hypothetical protein
VERQEATTCPQVFEQPVVDVGVEGEVSCGRLSEVDDDEVVSGQVGEMPGDVGRDLAREPVVAEDAGDLIGRGMEIVFSVTEATRSGQDERAVPSGRTTARLP